MTDAELLNAIDSKAIQYHTTTSRADRRVIWDELCKLRDERIERACHRIDERVKERAA